MAARELTRNWSTNYCLFYIDVFEEDSHKLPTVEHYGSDELSVSPSCATGSIAKDKLGNSYILTGDNEWVPYRSGGGSDGIGDLDIATSEEVDKILNEVF